MMHRIIATCIAAAGLSAGIVVKVDPSTRYQTYDGTGVSEAFQRYVLEQRYQPRAEQCIQISPDSQTRQGTSEGSFGPALHRERRRVHDPSQWSRIFSQSAIRLHEIYCSESSRIEQQRGTLELRSVARGLQTSDTSLQLNFIPLPRNDQYQVWLSKEARARGVNYIYADAW